MFDLSVRGTAPAVAGLVAAGVVAWLTRPAPAAYSLSLAGAAGLAARYVLLSGFAGLAVGVGLHGRRFNLRVVAAMVWLAPLALFLSQGSLWAALAAAAAGWHIAKSRRFRGRDEKSPPMVPSLHAACAAVLAQGGAVAAVLHRPLAAAACFGVGSAALAWSSNKQRWGDSAVIARRVLMPVAFAILFTLAGLIQYVGGAGAESGGAARMEDPAGHGPAPQHGTYRGVILLPEPAPHPVLVPPGPRVKRDLFAESRKEPVSIPFFGVYWMFRWPQSLPPADSYVVKGSPLTSVFRSSDRFPLSEEARQNFGTPIDLSCCSRIQLAIRSADVHSRFITLELILRDTTAAGRPSQTLGQQTVGSVFEGPRGEHAPPVETVLSFEVPRNSKIRQFDEATIRFQVRGPFATASARVAIDRFIFVPRGF